jgi:hypothetical protein
LLENGANHLRDDGGRTVLHKVAGVALSDLRSADETAKFVNTLQLLLDSVENPDKKKAVINPIDVNTKDNRYLTPLHYAIYMGITREKEIHLLHFLMKYRPNFTRD